MPPDRLAADHVERRIAAAVASHRIAPSRAAHYRALAKTGEDISFLDTLQPCDINASASTGSRPTPEDDEAAYAAMFPTPEQERAVADAQLAASVYSTASDKETYESIYGAGAWDK
jgi:hypothetical protein